MVGLDSLTFTGISILATESNGELHSDASFVDAAAERHFGLSLDQLEQGFIERLKTERLSQEWAEDLRLAATFYDRVREYQLSYDPSAYFLHAWLPPIEQMRISRDRRRSLSPARRTVEPCDRSHVSAS